VRGLDWPQRSFELVNELLTRTRLERADVVDIRGSTHRDFDVASRDRLDPDDDVTRKRANPLLEISPDLPNSAVSFDLLEPRGCKSAFSAIDPIGTVACGNEAFLDGLPDAQVSLSSEAFKP
jgi:hypothetical protein